MNSICDILIFKTNFEEENIFKNKFEKINEMLHVYLINSWLKLEKIEKENQIFDIIQYKEEELWIHIVYSIQKKLSINCIV